MPATFQSIQPNLRTVGLFTKFWCTLIACQTPSSGTSAGTARFAGIFLLLLTGRRQLKRGCSSAIVVLCIEKGELTGNVCCFVRRREDVATGMKKRVSGLTVCSWSVEEGGVGIGV